MKAISKYLKLTMIIAILFAGIIAQAQQPILNNYRVNGKDGINVFEAQKSDSVAFEGLKARIGGDFTMQFQSLNNKNTANDLVELGSNFNLPSANLNIDVQMYDGVLLHLRTYLSARHHEEAWVKGGHMTMDKLDFIKPGFLSGFMEYATITIGLDEFNYGDAHFRRTDNARAIFNPFVGNYIMDAFSTEAFGSVTYQKNSFIGVLGLTNGKLNQNVIVNSNSDNKASIFGKLGYDNQMNEDLRFRLTGSWYINKGTTTGTYLYGGDRGGSRYYGIMETIVDNAARAGSDFEGRLNPRFKEVTAIQINPFVKFKGLEFFGIYEMISNGSDQGSGKFTQIATEVLYRFGKDENLYLGGRYNKVSGEMSDTAPTMEINRINIGAGWFMTKNILTKVEYISQKYEGAGWTGGKYEGGEFNGLVIEATIGF
jgi:hypothetical protein